VDGFYPFMHGSLSAKWILSIHFAATVTDITLDKPDRPLRRDAARNRERILDAARELFAQRGLGVTLNDIAHHAGVGVGTVYRRFPDKAQLIEGLFEQRVETLVALGGEAVADPDPWHGLRHFLERALELLATDRGLMELVTSRPDGLERIGHVRERLQPLGTELVARARAAGRLRDDIAPEDLPLIQLMLTSVIDAAQDVDPDLWRRYLGIVLGGLATRPDREPPLPVGPLTAEQVDPVMTHLGRYGR
jgi:AcrR family transcriptional regulator